MSIETQAFTLTDTLPVTALNDAFSAARGLKPLPPSFSTEEFLARIGLGTPSPDGESLSYRLADGHPLIHRKEIAALAGHVREVATAKNRNEQQIALLQMLADTALCHFRREEYLCPKTLKMIDAYPELVPAELLEATEAARQQHRRRRRNAAKSEIADGAADGLTESFVDRINRSQSSSGGGGSRGSGDCDCDCI